LLGIPKTQTNAKISLADSAEPRVKFLPSAEKVITSLKTFIASVLDPLRLLPANPA
jgi:hypothetical protein